MSDETPVPGELAIEDHLAGYRLDEIIARGGMAVAYRGFGLSKHGRSASQLTSHGGFLVKIGHLT